MFETDVTITLIVVFLLLITGYYKWTYQYWERKKLHCFEEPFLKSLSNFYNSKKHASEVFKELYDQMKKRGWKHGGIYAFISPVYLVLDLDYVKNIMTKDFDHFTDRGIYYNEEKDPLSAHLFHSDGVKWRSIRTKITGTFTSAKLKSMFPTFLECEKSLQQTVQQMYQKNEPINIKEVTSAFTSNVIGSCAFGIDCNSFEDKNTLFKTYQKKYFERSSFRQFKRMFGNSFPKLARMLNVTDCPSDVSNFYLTLLDDTIKYRKENNITRNDFLQLLIKLYHCAEDPLTLEELAAETLAFFVAGLETSATLITFALYELAKHADIQTKVREEIKAVLTKHNGMSYEALKEMKYLDQVIDETLRIHPPIPLLQRRCVKDYKVPNSDVIIEKGTMVLIPTLAIHHDQQYYPNPKTFDPERFTEENKSQRHKYSHLPFGEGPRICIGMRFGLLQSKIGLTSLLKDLRFTVNEKTQEPLEMKANATGFITKEIIWLNADKV